MGVRVLVDSCGAVGDGIADDSAAIQGAVVAAGAGGLVVFGDGKTYAVATGIAVSNQPNLRLRGGGATLLARADVVPLTLSNSPGWSLDDLTLSTAVPASGAALRVTAGSTRYRARDLRIDSAGGAFRYGLQHDGGFLGYWDHLVIGSSAVSEIDAWFYDGSDAGRYPPTAITMIAPDLGGGTTGLKIESSRGFLLLGGAIENNRYAVNIDVTNSLHVVIDRVHCESPTLAAPYVRFTNCDDCVVRNLDAAHGIGLVNSRRTRLDGLHFFTLNIDAASTDTTITGGTPSSTAFDQEYGANTVQLGTQNANGGGALVCRHQGAVVFRTGYQTDTGGVGTLRWGTDVKLFRNAVSQLRTLGSLQADVEVRSAKWTTL